MGKPIMTGDFLSGPLQFKQLFEVCAFFATGYRDRVEPVTLIWREGLIMF